jgi:hypothetical protein
MQHTSDNSDGGARPFFSPEQAYAFSQPPSDLAVNQVKKQGSDQDYLPGEYIRLLLNRYIGPGMYDLDVALAGDLHIETVKKDKWENKKKVGTVDNVAVTANVSVLIVIYAADGSGRTRRYSAVGSHTMYGLAESGAGAIIGNAIKSAETSGLKRAVQPLGRAFGLDLKNKVTAAMMPPGIGYFRKLLEDRAAMQGEGQARIEGPAAAGSIEIQPAQNGVETTETVERVASPAANSKPAEQTARVREAVQAPRAEKAQEQAKPVAAAKTPAKQDEPADKDQAVPPKSEAAAAKQTDGKPADASSTGPATGAADVAPADEPAKGGAAAGDEQDWELTMTPTSYAQWIMCIKTLTRRVAAMTSEREMINFARRNSALISALPFYPAEGENPAKDFAGRWKTIMARRFASLGLAVPPQYAATDVATSEKTAQTA